ncbi:MAG: hypothetical protein WCK89_03910 [bacterium]
MKNYRHVADRSTLALLTATTVLYLSFLAYLLVVLKMNLLSGDARGYWMFSQDIPHCPLGVAWVPGYPVLIAALRSLTFGTVPPLVLMLTITGISYLLAIWTVDRLARAAGIPFPSLVAMVFAVSPFSGLFYGVYPIADTMTIALLLATVLALEKARWPAFIVLGGASLVAHKIAWFFIPLMMLIAFVKHKEVRPFLVLMLVPLFAWFVFGSFHHPGVLWFLEDSYKGHFASLGRLPVLDGLVGPLTSGNGPKVLKGILVATVLCLAAVSAFLCYRRRFWSGAAISLSLVLMAVTINSWEIWAVMRYSRMLVIPLAFLAAKRGPKLTKSSRWCVATLLIVTCIASNAAWAYYWGIWKSPDLGLP